MLRIGGVITRADSSASENFYGAPLPRNSAVYERIKRGKLMGGYRKAFFFFLYITLDI